MVKWTERRKNYWKDEKSRPGLTMISAKNNMAYTGPGNPNDPSLMINTVAGPQMIHKDEAVKPNGDGTMTVIPSSAMADLEKALNMRGFKAGGITGQLTSDYLSNTSLLNPQPKNNVPDFTQGVGSGGAGVVGNQFTSQIQPTPAVAPKQPIIDPNLMQGGPNPNLAAPGPQRLSGEQQYNSTVQANKFNLANATNPNLALNMPSAQPTATPSGAQQGYDYYLNTFTGKNPAYDLAKKSGENSFNAITASDQLANTRRMAANPNLTPGAIASLGMEANMQADTNLSKMMQGLETQKLADQSTAAQALITNAQAVQNADPVYQDYQYLTSQLNNFIATGQIDKAKQVEQLMTGSKYAKYNSAYVPQDWAKAGGTTVSVDNVISGLQKMGVLGRYEDANGQMNPTMRTELSNAISDGITKGAFSFDNGQLIINANSDLPWQDPKYYSEYTDWNGGDIRSDQTLDTKTVVNIPGNGDNYKTATGEKVTFGDMNTAWQTVLSKGTEDDYFDENGHFERDKFMSAYFGGGNAASFDASDPANAPFLNITSLSTPDGASLLGTTSKDGTKIHLFNEDGSYATIGNDDPRLSNIWYQFDQKFGSGAGKPRLDANGFAQILNSGTYTIDASGLVTNINDGSKVTSAFNLPGFNQNDQITSILDGRLLDKNNNNVRVVSSYAFGKHGENTSQRNGYDWSSSAVKTLNNVVGQTFQVNGKWYRLDGVTVLDEFNTNSRPSLNVTELDQYGNPSKSGNLIFDDSGFTTANFK